MASKQNTRTRIVEGQGRFIPSGVVNARGQPVVHQMSYVSPKPATVPLQQIRDLSPNARKQLIAQMTQSVPAQEPQDQEVSQEPSSKKTVLSNKKPVLPSSQDTSSLTETNDANDRKYDNEMIDDDETVRMSEKSQFADYPPLLGTFLELGSENAIPRLLTDINRLDLDRTQKLNLLRRLQTQLKTIDYHRKTFPKLYDVAYENTTVGEIASSLKDYVNYFVNKTLKADQTASKWDDRAGSAFADVPRHEMYGTAWADGLAKIIQEKMDPPAESVYDVQWYNIGSSKDYSDKDILEAFRGKRQGELLIKDLYEDIIDDALIHYLPNAVTFLLNKIDQMSEKKKPKEGIIDSALSLEDDMIQVKHYVNQMLHEIRQPLPMRKNVTDKSPELKMEENVGKVFSLYPIINKLIGAYTKSDPGERQFLHPHVAWETEKNKNAEAIKISRVLTEGTDLMSALDDLVNERVKKPVMTHENFLTVDETGLYIQDIKPRAFDAASNAINMINHFNLGRVGPANQGYIKYADFTDRFNKNFNILHPPSSEEEAAVEEEEEEAAVEEGEEAVSSLPDDPRQNKPDLTMSESKLSSTTPDNSSTSSPSRLPNADQISDNTLQKYSKEFEKAGYSLNRLKPLPPRVPVGEQDVNPAEDPAEESEISEVQINHVDPKVLSKLNNEIEVLNATNSQLKQMLRNLAGGSADEDPQSLFNQASTLYSARNDELAALRTELNTLKQTDQNREQLIKKYKTLQQATDGLKQQLTKHQDTRDKLEIMLRKRDETLATRIEENENLKRALKEAEEFAAGRELDYGKTLDQMADTIQRLTGELEQKTHELTTLHEPNQGVDNETVDQLENDIQNYVDQLQAANERIAELETAQSNARNVSHLSVSLQNLQAKLHEELQGIKTSTYHVKADIGEYVRQFNTKLTDLNDRIRLLNMENNALTTTLTATQADRDARLRDLGRLNERLRTAETERDVAKHHLRQQASQEPIFKPTLVDASTGTLVDMFKRSNTPSTARTVASETAEPEEFTFEGHTVTVPPGWPQEAKEAVAIISKQLAENDHTLKKFIKNGHKLVAEISSLKERNSALETEVTALNADVHAANVRADANEEFAKRMEKENRLARSASAPVGVVSAVPVENAPVVLNEQIYNDFTIAGLNQEIEVLRNELSTTQAKAAQVEEELWLQNEGLTNLNIQKDDEIREKNARIEELQQHLKEFNRRNVPQQINLASQIMDDSIEKLRKRSKSAHSADSYRLRREADYDYAASMHELERSKREQAHEYEKEILQLKAELQQQKEANDRIHEANKILHASGMELVKMDLSNSQQIGKMNLGASIYKDRQEHKVSLDLAQQGIAGDRAMKARAIKNNKTGELIATLAGSSDDAIRALGASMFANLLHDMATMTDEELQATNAPELIKMYDDGVISNIITALSTPRRAVDDSLAKRISDLENTTRSFINMMSQRTAHVGAAQAYHPPRRVFMGRGPAGVGKSNVRAPRKGRAKSKPVRKPKRGGRRSKK